jgi:hypothetical protein
MHGLTLQDVSGRWLVLGRELTLGRADNGGGWSARLEITAVGSAADFTPHTTTQKNSSTPEPRRPGPFLLGLVRIQRAGSNPRHVDQRE